MPNIPSVFPRISQHPLLTLFQVPLCSSLERSPSCLARAITSPMTNSATLRELLKGELKTAMPCFAAYCVSTWLVPMQKQPMTIKFLASRKTRAVSCVLERMPITWTSLALGVSRCSTVGTRFQGNTTPYPLDQLVLRQGGFQKVDLIPLGGQNISTCLVDVFKKQYSDIFGGKRFQRLRCSCGSGAPLPARSIFTCWGARVGRRRRL